MKIKAIMSYVYAVALVSIGVGNVKAGLVYYDYTSAPITSSILANSVGSAVGVLYISTSGANLVSGELQIDLSAYAEKGASHSAAVNLGAGFATASSNDLINAGVSFNATPTPVTSISAKGQTDFYDDYIVFRFNAGGGQFFYGWAEITANTSANSNGKDAAADLTIKRMAYNNTADASTIVGVIPEPASVAMILVCGIAAIMGRRIFNQ
ncbi:MAG: hypothetical protein V3V05_11150 [Pontiella sp.]